MFCTLSFGNLDGVVSFGFRIIWSIFIIKMVSRYQSQLLFLTISSLSTAMTFGTGFLSSFFHWFAYPAKHCAFHHRQSLELLFQRWRAYKFRLYLGCWINPSSWKWRWPYLLEASTPRSCEALLHSCACWMKVPYYYCNIFHNSPERYEPVNITGDACMVVLAPEQ